VCVSVCVFVIRRESKNKTRRECKAISRFPADQHQ